MTTTINQVTDFTAIEDAIEAWVVSASGFPTYDDRPSAFWAGFDYKRERPRIVITPISQPTQGHPWSESGYELATDSYKTTYYHPFNWSIQFTAYTDSYDSDGIPIRMTAYRYMQNVLNRSFMPSVQNILNDGTIKIASNPRSETVLPNVLAQLDDDKYIHQASIEYIFSGVVQTEELDTDYFETVTSPTEEDGTLILSED